MNRQLLEHRRIPGGSTWRSPEELLASGVTKRLGGQARQQVPADVANRPGELTVSMLSDPR